MTLLLNVLNYFGVLFTFLNIISGLNDSKKNKKNQSLGIKIPKKSLSFFIRFLFKYERINFKMNAIH